MIVSHNNKKLKEIGRYSLQDSSQEITIIAKGASTVFIGVVIGTGLKYFFELIVARHLAPKLFGIFFLGLAVYKISAEIATFGLNYGVLRYVAFLKGKGDENRVKGTIVCAIRIVASISIFVSFLLILFSKVISLNFFHTTQLSNVLKLFAVAIPFSALTSILIWSTLGFKIVKYRIFVREIFEPLLSIIIVIFLFIIGWKLFGAIFAFIIPAIFGFFLSFLFLKKLFPNITNKHVSNIFETKALLGFSAPLLLIGIVNFLISWLPILMLGYFRTSKEVGIFGPSQRTVLLTIIISTSFNTIFAPIISDLYERNQNKKLETLFKIVTKWMFSLTLPIVILLIFFSKQILALWGRDYIMGSSCLILLSIAMLIKAGVGSSEYLIMMIGKSMINLTNTIIAFLMIAILSLILIPKYGIIGAALAQAISIIFMSIIRLMQVYFILKIHPYRLDFFKPLLASVISSISVFLLTKHLIQTNKPLILLLIGSLVVIGIYTCMLSLLGFEKEEKFILNKIRATLY